MAWIAGLGAVAGGLIASRGSKKAGKAQSDAVAYAADLEHERYLEGQERLTPYLESGYAALNAINQELGLPSVEIPDVRRSETEYDIPRSGKATEYDVQTAFQRHLGRKPTGVELKYYTGRERADQLYYDVVARNPVQPKAQGRTPTSMERFAGFTETPGYQFVKEQGEEAITKAGAARGRRFSGASLKEGARYAAGLASTEYDKYFRRLQDMAGIGSRGTEASVNLGVRSAENQGALGLAGGLARASGISNRADIWGNVARDIGGIAADWWSS